MLQLKHLPIIPSREHNMHCNALRHKKSRSAFALAEHLEPRGLLSSYTFHTLADLSSTQLSDPSGVLVEDGKGDLFFTATQGASSNSIEALCELAKGSATPAVLTTFSGFGLE